MNRTEGHDGAVFKATETINCTGTKMDINGLDYSEPFTISIGDRMLPSEFSGTKYPSSGWTTGNLPDHVIGLEVFSINTGGARGTHTVFMLIRPSGAFCIKNSIYGISALQSNIN